MKQMKKITSLMMVMLLTLTFVACGSENAGYEGGKVTGLDQNESVAETIEEAVEDIAEESLDDSIEENAEEVVAEDVVEETAVAEDNEFSLGRMQGGVYTNEYLGVACELDSTWTFYSAEELQELPENVSDMMAGTELGDSLSQFTQITDMMAECATELTTVNVLYQKLSAQERLIYMAMDDKAIVEATLSSQEEILKESYAQAGIMVEEMAAKTVNFLGEERTALYTKSKVQEVDYYTLQLFNFNLGDYAVTITFSSFVEDKTEALLDLFYAL